MEQSSTPIQPVTGFNGGKARIEGIDILKGVLMLAVIYGHTITPLPDKNLVKWVLYGFHMPAFFMLSGLVLTASRIESINFSQLLKRYGRLLLPWLVASLLWLCLFNYESITPLTLKSMTRAIVYLVLYPSFHLWFVPALFAMVVVTWALVRFERFRSIFFALTLLPALFFYAVPWSAPALSKLKFVLGDPRFYTFFVYFAFGYYWKNQFPPVVRLLPLIKRWSFPLFGISLLAYCFSFFQSSAQLASPAAVFMNLAVFSHFPDWCLHLKEASETSRFMGWVGRNSFPIYLAHPFFMVPITQLEPMRNNEMVAGLFLWLAVTFVLYLIYGFSKRNIQNESLDAVRTSSP